MTPLDGPIYVTVAHAARRAGIAVSTMRHWLTEGRLMRYHRGPTKRVVVSVAELDDVMRVREADDCVADRG